MFFSAKVECVKFTWHDKFVCGIDNSCTLWHLNVSANLFDYPVFNQDIGLLRPRSVDHHATLDKNAIFHSYIENQLNFINKST